MACCPMKITALYEEFSSRVEETGLPMRSLALAWISDVESVRLASCPSQTTTYTLMVTSADGCASANTSSVTVTVVPCTVGEVSTLLWAPGGKDTLTWSATARPE